MALLPAIGEELFFRGALQKVLLRLSNKPWLAILVTSVIFALLHGTFFKILPIFILGCYAWNCLSCYPKFMVYILSFILSIMLLQYLLCIMQIKARLLKKLSNDKLSDSIYGAILSLIIGIGIIFFIKRKSDEVLPELSQTRIMIIISLMKKLVR